MLDLLAALVSPAMAAETVPPDGVWWQNLSYVNRGAALQGMISGIRAGWAGASSSYASVDSKLGSRMPTYSRNLDDYNMDITVFYNNHQNKLTVQVAALMICLSDDANTTPCEDNIVRR
ncbi:MAG: hypothetical protein WCE83_03870 [Candidatus Baltobacteraceae bacterium]